MTKTLEAPIEKTFVDDGKRVNREAWLWDIVGMIEPRFTKIGLAIPPLHISVGFPSRNALSMKKRVIGQCYPGLTSEDNKPQLFISPLISDTVEVVGVVMHEVLHAAVGTEFGHRKEFSVPARRLGLAGKPTATFPDAELKEWIEKEVAAKIEAYPHPKLVASGKFKPQGTRLLKAACTECGYTTRVTAKWVEQSGSPICPNELKPMEVQGYGEVVLNEELLEWLKEKGVDLREVNRV
jgi:hypothetical protein